MPTNLWDAATVLSGVSLLLSAGTLAVSTATLAEVRRLNVKMDKLLAGQVTTNQKLDQVIAKLDHLALNVNEARLATLVSHAISSAAVGSDEITFQPFGNLADDLNKFAEEAGMVRGLPHALRLGSDVRNGLERIVRLLRGVRLRLARDFNAIVGDPDRYWVCHPVNDYWNREDAAFAFLGDLALCGQVNVWDSASFQAHQAVDQCFSLNGVEDHFKIQNAVNRSLVATLMQQGVEEATAEQTVSEVLTELGYSEDDDENRFLLRDFSDEYAARMKLKIRQASCQARTTFAFPIEIIDGSVEDDENTDVFLDAYRSWWVHQTDAGLVYRALKECVAIQGGYETAFPESMPALPADGAPTAKYLPAPVVVDLGHI
jgi:hypothetical protein